MAEMVDSRKQQLNPFEIVTIAIQNTGSEYPMEVALPAIATEMSQPNSKEKLIGNTLFSVLTGKNGQGFFKAYNADIAPNYVQNSKQFCIWAKEELGMKILVTEFKDRAISNLFHIIARNPPMEGMGFKEYKTTDGGSRIVLNLGE